jgi:hypothetical protein
VALRVTAGARLAFLGIFGWIIAIWESIGLVFRFQGPSNLAGQQVVLLANGGPIGETPVQLANVTLDATAAGEFPKGPVNNFFEVFQKVNDGDAQQLNHPQHSVTYKVWVAKSFLTQGDHLSNTLTVTVMPRWVYWLVTGGTVAAIVLAIIAAAWPKNGRMYGSKVKSRIRA